MTAPTAPFVVPVTRPRAFPLTRALGVLGMLGAPAFPVIGALHPGGLQERNPLAVPSTPDNLLMLAYMLGLFCSALGLRRLRATGAGRGGAAVSGVQLTAATLAALQCVQDVAHARPLGGAFYFATDMGWPFSHVYMLVVFAAVWRAGVLTGWRRWPALAAGLVLPLTFAAGASRGLVDPNFVFPYGTAAAFLALGLAVATAPRAAAATKQS